MYKLVIVDDEKRIRLGLKNIVEWEKLGFEVTELFADGQEVIEYLEYVTPDVILTDIKMNYVSGLEVARYVFERQIPCKVVLVSGYQEFELAIQGIRYGAEDYLLKPTDVDCIEETFSKLKAQLDVRKEQQLKEESEKARMEEAIPLLEEHFFSDLVLGVADSEEYIRSCIGILYPHMEVGNSRCLLADISIQEYENFMQKIWQYSYDQFEVNLSNFLRIYKNSYSFHIVYKADHLIELLGIQIGDQDGENVDSCIALEALINELEENFHFRADYEILQEYDSIFQIGDLREKIWEKEKDKLVAGQYLKEQKKLVISNITMGNIITAQKIFHHILEELRGLPSVTFNNVMIDIMSTMNTVIQEVNEKLSLSLQSYFNYSAVLCLTSVDEAGVYMDRIFDRIRIADEKKEYFDTGSFVSKAKNYIRENIYKDVSQEETANFLYICPSYLSRMFKKQTGESFLQYVTRVKMEKAIELLRDPRYKTYQVSEILGYKTPRYFSRLFRTYTGMNPSEYRKKVLHLGGEMDEG